MGEFAAKGESFFLWASFFDPHPRYMVPEPYASMYDPARVTVPEMVPEELDDKPPYFALSFRSLKSNGSYRYYQYLKGRFSAPTEETATKGDSPDPKTTQLTYTAIPTVYEFDLGDINAAVKRVFGDEDTDNFSATGWFSQVQTPSAVAASDYGL